MDWNLDLDLKNSYKEGTESEDLVPFSGLERNCGTNSTCGGTVLPLTTCTTNTTTAATSNADKTADLAEIIFFSNWQTVAKVGSHCCARLQLSLIHCQSWLCTLPHKPLLSNPPNPPQDRTLGRIDFFKVFRVAAWKHEEW